MKNIPFLIILSILAFFTSCNNEDELVGAKQDTSSISKERSYVFAYKTSSKSGIETRAGVNKRKLWDNGETIRVKFLNGSAAAQNKVKEVAAEWSEYANIDFEYVGVADEADVKVAFQWQGDRVTWSYLGTDCLDVEQDEPSMNIMLFNGNDLTEINSADFAALILREFGHVLGLIYEHQGPESGVDLDMNRVYSYFRPFGWSDALISDVILHTYTKFQTNYTEFDENSIMLLFFPPHLTTNGVGSNKWNTKLSDTDKAFIEEVYPGRRIDPDPYERGAVGSVYMTMPTYYSGGYGTLGYNYDTGVEQAGGLIEKTYKTIVVGEYEWTAENLRIKYRNLWGTLYEFMNHTEAKIHALADGNNCPLPVFEQTFGTWVTEYGEARAYRDNYKFYKSKNGEEISGFELPATADICQLLATAPVKPGNTVYGNVETFLYASDDDIPSAVKPLINMKSYNNTSGLGMTPLGFKGNNPDDSGVHYSFGYGFGLRMKNYARIFAFSHISGIKVNTELYHFTQARYCRKLTDAELGYKLYIDTTNDKVLMLGLTDNSNGLAELPKGLERGIALRYANKEKKVITKSWTDIKNEAIEMKKSISIE